MTRKYTRAHIKAWKAVNGSIPKDQDGRSYEIHHIDGDVSNNSIENLLCLSINDHYELHVQQKDFGGAFLIARRMKIKPSDISETARKAMKTLVENGNHPFLDPNFPRKLDCNKGFVVALDLRTNQTVRITKQDFDNNSFYVGSNHGRKQKLVHTNRGGNKGKKWKIQNKEIGKKCLYCDFEGRASLVSRWHNERCKNNK